MQLEHRKVLVTGGGRGIGRAIALALAREGADVAVTARSQDEIQRVAEEIKSLGRRSAAIGCDVTDPHLVLAMVEAAVESLGGLEILVNNAGGSFQRAKVAESAPDIWKQTLDVNLLGTYYCCRAAIPHLIAGGGGKIINVSSGMAHQPRGGNSAYNTAKAGVWMLTRCLALELAEHRIDVNEFVPGPVYTDLTADIFDPSGKKPPPFADTERVKQPEECGPMVVFMAAQPAGGPTGQSFSLARRPVVS